MGLWGGGKGTWGKGGKGSYAMEDEWSYGLSGYSYEDVPLFLNSLTQEATGNWQVARPNKTAKKPSVVNGCPSRCASTSTGDHTACQCFVSRGRYHAISEAYYDPYLGDYDSSDLDPMLMVNIEEGDVPPKAVAAATVEPVGTDTGPQVMAPAAEPVGKRLTTTPT